MTINAVVDETTGNINLLNTSSPKVFEDLQSYILYHTRGCNLVIGYHADCIDGYTAAWAFRMLMEDRIMEGDNINATNVIYIPLKYDNDISRILACSNEKTTVVLLDFAYSPSLTKILCESVKQVIVIDHHETSILLKTLSLNNFHMYHTKAESAAYITWALLRSETPPLSIQMVSDRDTWKFKLPDTNAFNAYLSSIAKTWEKWNSLMLIDNVRASAVENGYAMLEAKKGIIDSYLATATEGTIYEFSCLYINCPNILSSDTAEALRVKYRESKYNVIACFRIEDKTVYYSLRTGDGTDVSLVAEVFGGGGHKGAAGFTLRIEDSHLVGIGI